MNINKEKILLALDIGKGLFVIIVPVLLGLRYQQIYNLPFSEQYGFFSLTFLWILCIISLILLDRKFRTSLINRKIQTHQKALKDTKFRLEECYRVNQLLDELDACVAKRIPKYESDSSSSFNSIHHIFDLDVCMSELITQIYYFYSHDPRKLTEQQYRVTFTVPENDNEMMIKYFQTPGGEKPISFSRGERFPKNTETIAGCVWATMQPYKIEDIEEHLKNQKPGECHFKVIHQDQKRKIKSIFSIPIYDEPQPSGNFYGVLNIDTNIVGRFKPIPYNMRDHQLDIIKPFLKRMGYFFRMSKYLNQKT